jgi:hypothetical protein
MQSAYAGQFQREMGCTQEDWLRSLPAAIGDLPWQSQAGRATVAVASGSLTLDWHAGEPRVIASVRLPRLHVSFRFEGVSPGERLAFMKRFDMYMQRGGG